MDAWGSLLAQPKPTALEQAQQLSHIKYTAPLQHTPSISERSVITIESRGLILSGGTTGNRTWEAALHLGSFLASPAGEALVRGKRVIELGAGTGFLSLFCARHLGVLGVVATDREPVLIENMRDCTRLNQGRDGDETTSLPMYSAVWNWGTPLEQTEEMALLTKENHLHFDIALGADLVCLPCLSLIYTFIVGSRLNQVKPPDLRRRPHPAPLINAPRPLRELPHQTIYHCRNTSQRRYIQYLFGRMRDQRLLHRDTPV